eukprot:303969-Pleurochrysis_carterae.AAC.1
MRLVAAIAVLSHRVAFELLVFCIMLFPASSFPLAPPCSCLRRALAVMVASPETIALFAFCRDCLLASPTPCSRLPHATSIICQ